MWNKKPPNDVLKHLSAAGAAARKQQLALQQRSQNRNLDAQIEQKQKHHCDDVSRCSNEKAGVRRAPKPRWNAL